ncbi:hypothetical protein L195_g001028 [Trifolium pratense]|uniref:Uncharacterized protein n=1 Tax=Trifolium pratense TaxID=57577 RepID=A0A2K3NNI9_TRIPR|nr:hypothetical protein L195_g001028 [Trifolium pratense]
MGFQCWIWWIEEFPTISVLNIVEYVVLDILDASKELVFLAKVVIDDKLVPHHVIESKRGRPPICIRVETVWRSQMFEVDSSNSQQLDRGRRNLVFNNNCTMRVFRSIVVGQFLIEWKGKA